MKIMNRTGFRGRQYKQHTCNVFRTACYFYPLLQCTFRFLLWSYWLYYIFISCFLLCLSYE